MKIYIICDIRNFWSMQAIEYLSRTLTTKFVSMRMHKLLADKTE